MSQRNNSEALHRELDRVQQLIAAHPLASAHVRAAHDVIDQAHPKDQQTVDQQLAARDLRDTKDLGRTQVTGSWSWWKLHRRKRKLERAIERSAR